MTHISEIIEDILVEWAYRVHDGMPNPKNTEHIQQLRESMEELNLPNNVIYQVIQNLINEKENPILKKTIKYKTDDGEDKEGTVGGILKKGEDHPAYKQAKSMVDKDKPEKEKKEKEPKKVTFKKTDDYLGGKDGEKSDKEDKPTDTKPTDDKPTTTSGVSSESIDAIDGDAKNKTLSGEEPPPGTESSAVAEIGVGFGMGCLSENNNDMEAAEKCLEEKLSKSKLGAKHGTGSGKKAVEARKGMLQAARRENQKVKEVNEELGWENSQTSHIGGSKTSLESTVKVLKEKGVKEVNGVPIDEYEKIILGGGAGENPTDTMVCVVNEETGEAIMYHTSNKMTSKDQIANGSPAKEIREITKLGDFDNEEQEQQAAEAGEETRKNIGKHRNDQKKYIQQQQDKMIEDSKDPKIARKAVDRLKGVNNPVTDAADPQKYWKKLTGHPSIKKYMDDKGYDSKNLTPEQEVEIYQHYAEKMKEISSMDNPPESRRQGGIGDDDIQMITRLYGEGQEEATTGNSPREPIFSNKEMQSFYDKQTEELNSLREKMNKIKPGSGDKAFGERMAKRLHLDMAEGHNPGGIPNNRAETVMGVYGYKDLKQDEDGNMYQKKGGKFYKVDNDGNVTDEEVDESTLKDYDCAVVADKGTMSKCLGMEEGDKATDDLGITMGRYEGTKAIIYDRNGKQIGVQTARSKTGPGGSMQDSVAYHKDFQQCLARETKLQGKCG